MKKIDFNIKAGFPVSTDTLEFMQQSIQQVEQASSLGGNLCVLRGCANVGGIVSDGFVTINGEVLPFVGGNVQTKVIIVDNIGNRIFFSGANNPYYHNRYATFGVTGNPLTEFLWADFKINNPTNGVLARLDKLEAMWVPGDIKELACNASYIAANFDNTGLGINERQGWAICNGNNGTINKKGRVSVMLDTAQTEFDTIGKTGGAKTHSLTVSEMPSHTHGIKYFPKGAGDGNNVIGIEATPNGPLTDLIQNTGGNQEHNNLQPYIVTLFIQKL